VAYSITLACNSLCLILDLLAYSIFGWSFTCNSACLQLSFVKSTSQMFF
jgi:hypothetical protein